MKNPELLIQERFQRLAKFQTQSMEKTKCTDLLARDTSIHAQFARALGWFSQMEQPWENKYEGINWTLPVNAMNTPHL